MAKVNLKDTKFKFENPLTDPTFWGVVGGNFLSIYLALSQQWSLGELLWVFWAQSVIIGIANIIRMLNLTEFTTEGLKMNDEPVPETRAAQLSVVGFFALHYGFFHFVYFVFLFQDHPLTKINAEHLPFILLGALGFLGAHFFSLWRNFGHDFKEQKPNLGTLMFYPYLRIIPMHLTIIIGGSMGEGSGMTLFLVLKTFADAGMHIIERAIFRSAPMFNPVLKD